MHPEIPETTALENPYQYTEWGKRVSVSTADRAAGRSGAGRAHAIHEVLERHQVTEEEWMAALAFLTEVGRADEFVLLSDVTRTSVLIDALSHAERRAGATASDVEGPLYTRRPAVAERRSTRTTRACRPTTTSCSSAGA